jgi:hypothetical protein
VHQIPAVDELLRIPGFLEDQQNVDHIRLLAHVYGCEHRALKDVAEARVQQCLLQLLALRQELVRANRELYDAEENIRALDKLIHDIRHQTTVNAVHSPEAPKAGGSNGPALAQDTNNVQVNLDPPVSWPVEPLLDSNSEFDTSSSILDFPYSRPTVKQG